MIFGWKRLKWYPSGIEVWKTPTRYLTCHHYLGIFRFSDTIDDAFKNIEKIKEEMVNIS